jgi:hypothetical protein
VVGPGDEVRDQLRPIHGRVREAWARAGVLTDPELHERMLALDMVLFLVTQPSMPIRRRDDVNPWPVTVAFDDVRQALAAFQRHEDPPEAQFLTRDELSAATNQDRAYVGYAGVANAMFDKVRRQLKADAN